MPRRLFFKTFIAFLALIIIISAAVYFFAKPALLLIANKELSKISSQSSINGIRITKGFIEFQDIAIKKDNFLDIKAGSVNISYTLKSLSRKKAGFHIKNISFNKLKMGDATGRIEIRGSQLSVNHILADFLGGSIEGEFNVSLDKSSGYFLILKSKDLDIKRFVDDMELNEKFSMTGRMQGGFYISGKDNEIKDIKGDFQANPAGGTLVIRDKRFLENIARQSNQQLDIIVESFKNYNYNKGMASLNKEGGNLILDIKLEGEAGRRNLTVVLHDFNTKGEGL